MTLSEAVQADSGWLAEFTTKIERKVSRNYRNDSMRQDFKHTKVVHDHEL